MPFLDHVSPYLRLQPVVPGGRAPALSLTADEGTWVRLTDLQGRQSVLLVFFGSLADEPTHHYLRSLQKARSRFEKLDSAIFGVNQHRTDKLRAYRSRLGLEFYLLYDPLALTSRTFGCSSPVRPRCQSATVLVGADGRVLFSERGYADVAQLLQVVARARGGEVPPDPTERGS
jgi:thioredoxin-dependent peroxiredoxin